mgnify:CR=1 FL=1
MTMASDDDYDPNEDDSNESPSINLRRRRAEGVHEVGRTNSSRKVLKTGMKEAAPRNSFDFSRKSIAKRISAIKKSLVATQYTRDLSIRVVHMALKLRDEYLAKKTKYEAAYEDHGARVRERVIDLLGISSSIYTRIMNTYLTEGTKGIYLSSPRGNHAPKSTRLARTKSLQHRVREYVRSERAERRRVTARQVLEFMLESKDITVELDEDGKYEKRALATAYRRCRGYLQQLGYKRGKRSGNIVVKQHIAVKRDLFLKAFFENRRKRNGRLREVFLDESYIHQHYNKNEDSVYDPNDEQDLQVGKQPHKGNRYCFLCAIQGPAVQFDHDVDDKAEFLALPQPTDADDKPRVVPGSVWAFCPTEKKMHKGDYHKVFNSSNFLRWWKDDLLPNLKSPSLIIMDNAAYHCTYPEHVPKASSCRKEELIAYCELRGIDFDESDTRPILKEKVSQHIAEEEEMECELLARAHGHRVLFQPPHHSDFQPIELLWAKLKGNIGRQYSSNTTMAVLKQRLDEEFTKSLEWNNEVGGMIRASRKICRSFYTTYKDSLADSDSSNSAEESDSDRSEDEELFAAFEAM